MSVTPRKDRYQLMKAGYEMASECELCSSTENLVIDHIIPLSRGGSNELDNLRTLCNSCDAKEGWRYRERSKLIKYTTHLRPETIRRIKRYAFEHGLKDYEVVQQALDEFLGRQLAAPGDLPETWGLVDGKPFDIPLPDGKPVEIPDSWKLPPGMRGSPPQNDKG